MKDYLVGILVFACILGFLGWVTYGQTSSVSKARQDLELSIGSLSISTNNSMSKNLQLKAQFGNADVAKFMRENGTTLQSMKEIGTINQRIGSESEALRIPIQEQKTESRSMKGRQGTVLSTVQMHEYSIAILSTFKDSLLWLGKIEDAFPYARVESIIYTPSGEYVNLETKILFPILDTSVISK